MLLEKENEKKSLQEFHLQTKQELTSTCQQLDHLRQEIKKNQEREQVGVDQSRKAYDIYQESSRKLWSKYEIKYINMIESWLNEWIVWTNYMVCERFS